MCDISGYVWSDTMTPKKKNRLDTYLQFLHFSPNNIPFPHTMHVWDIQYFVENLHAKEERVTKKISGHHCLYDI